jgi:Uma2 family endonuclease
MHGPGNIARPIAFPRYGPNVSVAMPALAKLAPSRMTVAEFLDWPGDGTFAKYELVDGEPRAMAPASITHGIIQANLARLLGNHLLGTACQVVTAPGVIPRVRSATNVRVPDLAVNCVADEQGQRALPDPVLIIEILSPSNENETRANVWAYTTIPSVREILLVRSTDINAELLCRELDGNWPEQPLMIEGQVDVTLDSIGFRVPLVDIYSGTHLAR